MKKLQFLALLMLLIAALFCSASSAWAQDVTATITGTVTDPSGAPIVGATATAHDTERGTNWTSLTNESGVYNLIRIPVGTYQLKVEAKGFQSVVHAPFTLVLNQTARLDVDMKVGEVSQTVEVSGDTPLLQTQSTEVSTLIDAKAVTSVPLASRNYLQLTLLAPGATNVDPDGMRMPQNMLNSGRPYINGNREQANAYLLDGQLNSEDKNNEVGYTPGVDAIQEFNLITQNASAEFGNYEGGVVSATIKSGTNSFHGDVFEFFRNDALNSNNASAGWTIGIDNGTPGHSADGAVNKPELRYNQFGGTIGGPILKNKLFFFADYQGQRTGNAGTTSTQLLTTSARAGNFGQLCTDAGGAFNASGICAGGTNAVQLKNPNNGNPIPFNNLANAGLAINPVAQAIFNSKYYPAPQKDTLYGNNDFFSSGNYLNNDQGDLKLDYVISAKDHVSGRWSQMNLRQPTFSTLPFANQGAVEGITEPVRNVVVDWTHSFTPTLLNEVRAGFNAVRFDQNQTPTSSLGNISEQLGIAGANLQAPGLIQLNIAGNGPAATASLGLQNLVQDFRDAQLQVEDNVLISRGRHTLKTGFQFVRLRENYIYPGNNGVLGFLNIDSLTGSSLADFYLGDVAGSSFRDTGGASTLDQLRGSIYSAFVQDDWRVTDTLTLNLGVRFEDHTPFSEVNNRVVNFNLQSGAVELPGQNGNSRALYQNYLGIGDWLPRIGLAWSPKALHGKTVVRAGYAVSSYVEGGGGNEELTQNPPFGIIQQTAPVGIGSLADGFPAAPVCPVIQQSCYNGQRIRIFDQHFRPALSQQWNLTLQHQLTNSLTAQIGYVGQHGTHLLNFQDLAQLKGLNAAGTIALPGQPIVTRVAGNFLGGDTPGSLYAADNPTLGGKEALAGTNMSNASQRYDALQAVLQKRFTNGLQGQLAYTWSKCLSDSAGYYGTGWASTNAQSSGGQPGTVNIYNQKADYGPCYFDQAHIVTAYATYQLPVGRGRQFGRDMNPVLNAVVGNWEVSGIATFHTGNALTLNEFGGWGVGGDTSHTNGIEPYTLSGRPDCNGPVNVIAQHVAANVATGAPAYIQWIDPSNVSNPAPNTFGTCSVGNVRGPHYSNFDFGLHKGFTVTERMRFEFRAEALNAFNHPVYTFLGGPANGSFDPSPGNQNFGRITGTQGARELQLALKFLF